MFQWSGCRLTSAAAVGLLGGLSWATSALAQAAPPTGSLPPLTEGPSPGNSPTPLPSASPAPTSPPAPASAPTPSVPPAPSTTAPTSSVPATSAPAPQAYPEPVPPTPPPSDASETQAYPEPVPPPPQKPESEFSIPAFSIRVDPFNWLLDGRLGLEFEAQVWKFVSVELVPVFVTTATPPSMRIGDFDGAIEQHSNGWGALAGSSLGAGFWLSGKALRGTVLRAIFTNYGYRYTASDAAGTFDEVSHTERHFYGYLGSHSRFGAFTLAGGVGLGVELNKQNRCFESLSPLRVTSKCEEDEQLILVSRPSASGAASADLHSWSYPIQLMFRFSLGLTFD